MIPRIDPDLMGALTDASEQRLNVKREALRLRRIEEAKRQEADLKEAEEQLEKDLKAASRLHAPEAKRPEGQFLTSDNSSTNFAPNSSDLRRNAAAAAQAKYQKRVDEITGKDKVERQTREARRRYETDHLKQFGFPPSPETYGSPKPWAVPLRPGAPVAGYTPAPAERTEFFTNDDDKAADITKVDAYVAGELLRRNGTKDSVGPRVTYKTFSGPPIETPQVRGDQGLVTVIANTTAVRDYQDDYLVPGCYAKVIPDFQSGKQRPKVLVGHDQNRIAGKVAALAELLPGSPELPPAQLNAGAGALKATLAFNLSTKEGADAFSNVKFGALDEYSIGWAITEGDAGSEIKDGVRYVKSIELLLEVSPVLMGASPMTGTLQTANRKPNDQAQRIMRAVILELNRDGGFREQIRKVIRDGMKRRG